MSDPEVSTTDERRRLLEASVVAAQFFRAELLRAPGDWSMQHLKEARVEQVLSADSAWKIGYAPDTLTSLADHLAAENFSYSTMERAGLVVRSGESDVVDRFRDQLVLLARDAQLRPAGFVAVGRDGQVQSSGTASNAVVGIEEQLDLLRGGTTPVIVDDPVDAIAVSNVSRQFDGRWAGVPAFGSGLSTAQVRMLRKFSLGDTAIVIAVGDEHRRKLASGYLLDLSLYYDRVRAVVMPYAPSTLAAVEFGPEYLNDLLATGKPVLTYGGGRAARDLAHEPGLPDRGPGL